MGGQGAETIGEDAWLLVLLHDRQLRLVIVLPHDQGWREDATDRELGIEILVTGIDGIARFEGAVEVADGELTEVLFEGELGIDDGHRFVDIIGAETGKFLPDLGNGLGTNLLLHEVEPDVGRVHESPAGFVLLVRRVQRHIGGVIEVHAEHLEMPISAGLVEP